MANTPSLLHKTQVSLVKPKVSVCVPTYNRAPYLEKAIQLILNQSYQDFELIVCDDASTDNTLEVVGQFKTPRLSYYRNKQNLGIPGNLLACMRHAKGEYVLVLHDHDEYEPSLLGEMVAVMEFNPGVGFVHTAVDWMNDKGEKTQTFIGLWNKVTRGERVARELLKSFSSLICAESMVRRSCYDEVGGYDPRFGFVSDVDLWFRLAMRYDVGYIAKPLIRCREREKNHPYSGVNWELSRLLVKIHRENINRFYSGKPWRKKRSLFRWKFMRDLLYFKLLLKSWHDHSFEKVAEGLHAIHQEGSGLSRFFSNGLRCFFWIRHKDYPRSTSLRG